MATEAHAPLPAALRSSLRGRVVVVGIGNSGRGDDGAGPRVARMLARCLPAVPSEGDADRIVAAIVAETTPEAEVDRIAALRPKTVLLVDAVDFGAAAGAVDLFDEADLPRSTGWSVHRPPLGMLMQYLSLRSGARTLLLGIQAGNVDWGAPMSTPVKAATAAVVRSLHRWSEGGEPCA